jgi:hypothetical protein
MCTATRWIARRYPTSTCPKLMDHQAALRRFSMWVAAGFGCLALGLAILGTYGLRWARVAASVPAGRTTYAHPI